MTTYAEFSISGDAARGVFEGMPRSGPGWHLEEARTKRFSRNLGREGFVVAIEGGETYPASEIAFSLEDNGVYLVANVVPDKIGQELTPKQYNQILLDFYNAVIRGRVGADLSATPPRGERDISEFLDAKGVQLLRTFSGAANKSSGASHPLDFQRWALFVSHTYKNRQRLASDVLLEALLDLDWPEEEAHELVGEYETFMELLSVHETGSLFGEE